MSYLICSTPRSGTNYLKNMLISQGMGWAWEVGSAAKNIEPEKLGWNTEPYYEQFNTHGVWSRTLWWYMKDKLVSAFAYRYQIYGEGVLSDREIIETIHPDMKYIFLQRRGLLRQAISYIKAKHSNQWYQTNETGQTEAFEHKYDSAEISRNIRHITGANTQWQKWFKEQEITPIHVVYEDLVDNPIVELKAILEALGNDDLIDVTALEYHINKAPHSFIRQSDDVTEEWVKRYMEEQVK